uniref:AP complex subunit sigma n=1 Tax=Schistocephalus solidus TaxID=70667 RepID=A0A0X3PYX9_SCHSO
MIWAVLIFNTNGKPRLIKFFEKIDEADEQKFLAETFRKLTRRSCESCNFLEIKNNKKGSRLIYRQYATIYVVFCVDAAESELGILDLIQVFVDLLDKTFENVCELDIIFNADKVIFLLSPDKAVSVKGRGLNRAQR